VASSHGLTGTPSSTAVYYGRPQQLQIRKRFGDRISQ